MGGKKPIGAMPSRGSLQRYGSSRGRPIGPHALVPIGMPSPNPQPLQPVGVHSHQSSLQEYSLFSGLNLADNGQPWIFKDEITREGSTLNPTQTPVQEPLTLEKADGSSESDPKQRLFGKRTNYFLFRECECVFENPAIFF